jgi:hypothetical protein
VAVGTIIDYKAELRSACTAVGTVCVLVRWCLRLCSGAIANWCAKDGVEKEDVCCLNLTQRSRSDKKETEGKAAH